MLDTLSWTPAAIRGDDEFNHKTFSDLVNSTGSKFEPTSLLERQNSVTGSRHGIITSIFIRLQEAIPTVDSSLHAAKALDICSRFVGQ